MSKQPLLNESTQRRLLLLAGMSHFSDEVITESKKDGIPAEPDYTGGEKSLKSAPGAKKEEACPPDDKKKLNEEIPQDDTMEAAPVSPPAAPAPEAAPPLESAPPVGNSANVDLKKFAAEFANFLKAQGHEIQLSIDGEDVSQEVGATEDEFGDLGSDLGGEEGAPPAEGSAPEEAAETPEEEAAEPPADEPKMESKEKQVAKLVYEEVLRTLTANAGIDLDKAKKAGKVKIKVADKKKATKK